MCTDADNKPGVTKFWDVNGLDDSFCFLGKSGLE